MKRTAIMLACLSAGACAMAPSEVAILYDPAQPTAAVAQLLADADAAQDHPKRLGMLIATLDRLGAHPAAGSADVLSGWRSKAKTPKTPPFRGRLLGPAYKNGMLDPGKTVRLPQLFDGGRAAKVAVATPSRAGLEFTVLDSEAKPVCPPGTAQNRQCTWTPMFTGRFEIVLANPTNSATGYYLVID